MSRQGTNRLNVIDWVLLPALDAIAFLSKRQTEPCLWNWPFERQQPSNYAEVMHKFCNGAFQAEYETATADELLKTIHELSDRMTFAYENLASGDDASKVARREDFFELAARVAVAGRVLARVHNGRIEKRYMSPPAEFIALATYCFREPIAAKK